MEFARLDLLKRTYNIKARIRKRNKYDESYSINHGRKNGSD